ncbi:hypothetical protein K4F52_002772 [Lecanicillium sp. MT-2017a]|nr:hypothetical protein K4F52_002772 [Lecanicillium sp. MT-2017a]
MVPSEPSGRCQRIVKLTAATIFVVSFLFCAAQVLSLPLLPGSILGSSSNGANTPSEILTPETQSEEIEGIYGLTHMQQLPKHLVPTPSNKRRLIIIGDIHGMDRALDKLLKKVKFDPKYDHVIAAGDMVNKGPHSAAVVSRLMEINASAVRGNHEDRILLALAGAQARQSASQLDDEPKFDAEGAKRDLKTARKLSTAQVKWLTQLPLILDIDLLDMFVVHAGLVPGIKPRKQDPWAVMNMRTLVYPKQELRRSGDFGEDEEDDDEDSSEYEIDAENGTPVPIDTHEGRKWAPVWDHSQRSQRKHTRRTVVYGHDARRGLTVGKYTFGLDSGCVGKGQLTALIVEADGEEGAWKSKIKQIECKKLRK